MEYKIMTILNEIKSLIEGKISNHWMNIDEVTNYSSLSHLACPPKVVPSVKLVFVQTERNKEYDT